jgi:hypothetical protein
VQEAAKNAIPNMSENIIVLWYFSIDSLNVFITIAPFQVIRGLINH